MTVPNLPIGGDADARPVIFAKTPARYRCTWAATTASLAGQARFAVRADMPLINGEVDRDNSVTAQQLDISERLAEAVEIVWRHAEAAA